MGDKKVERIYNKDRIRRIKEASENAKKIDPNWEKDAPPGIMQNYDDDLPVSQSKTPPFLKEVNNNELNPDTVVMKKLTINELTQCTKDSSQLMHIMNSSGKSGPLNANDTKPVNYLEMSRLKKVKERDDFNRQTAENLHKASEKWHSQLKEFNKNKNTQDSNGVRSSLFVDESNEYEKSETERNEKRSSARRFSSDFTNKLDLLLQRGIRHPRLSRNIGSLREINERSYSRWTNRLNKFSSMWDLRYPLLSHSLGADVPGTHLGSDSRFPGYLPEAKFHSSLNLSNEYNQTSAYPSSANHITNTTNQNPYFPSPQFVPNYTPQYSDPFSQKPVMLQSANQNHFLTACSPRPSMSGSPFQQPVLWQNPLPGQNTYSNTPTVLPFSNPAAFMSPASFEQQSVMNSSNLSTNTNSANYDTHLTFEMMTRKIDLLAEKLDVLNLTVDQMKSVHTGQNCKPIIKTHKHVSSAFNSDNSLSGSVVTNRSQVQSLSCTCPNCIKTKLTQNPPGDRRVRFDISEDDTKANNSHTNDSSELIVDPEDSSNTSNIEKTYMELCSKSIHPHFIEQQFPGISKQFKSFKLPSELVGMRLHSAMNSPR